jgi:hypothetical protein
MISRTLDAYYLAGVPLVLGCAFLALAVRRLRYYLFVSAFVFLGVWILTMKNREARYHYLDRWMTSKAEILSALGQPERIVKFKEGDELWTYSVRSYPWTRFQWYSIYKERVLASTRKENVGLFEKEEIYVRSAKEAEITQRNLMSIDRMDHAIRGGEKIKEPNQPPDPTPPSGAGHL